MSIDPSTHGDAVLDRLARTARLRGPEPLAGRLEDLGAQLAQDVGEVDKALSEMAAARGDLAERAAGHLLHHPGKRIRASCALLASRLGPMAAQAPAREAAIAAELVHAATLLHDDVIDEGTERRGVEAARVVYGNSASILGGDHLLVEALRRVHKTGAPALMSELLQTIADMVAAEAIQLERRGIATQDAPDELATTYLAIARGKTAALFRWALRSGARLSGLASADVDAIGEFGESLGLAFQLVDDALDLDGDPAVTGKNALADLREGKITWPLLVALSRDPGIATVMQDGGDLTAIAARDLSAIADRIRATGAARETRAEAARHVKEGLRALAQLPDSPARRAFAALVEGTLGRER